MSEIRLFRVTGKAAAEIPGEAGGLEKSLQTLFEGNLETLLGVRFLATEHSTGAVHRGRIDTLGMDENGCPVIVEYKRAVSENVVNQGLYYLNWLLDHRAEFKLLVLEGLGKREADAIDWSAPRLICVAADFTKFDEQAIQQMNRNIDLIRYKRFGKDLLALELETSITAPPSHSQEPGPKPRRTKGTGDKPVAEAIAEMNEKMRDLYEGLRAFTLGLGDDVTEKHLKLYVAFRRIKNFVTVTVLKKGICLYMRLDPSSVKLDNAFMRDVTGKGHWGTGDLEVWVTDRESMKAAQDLIARAYEGG